MSKDHAFRLAPFTTALLLFVFVNLNQSHLAWADDPNASQPTTISVFGEGELKVPSSFKKVQPRSRIIQHEFAAHGEDQDGTPARVTFMPAGGDIKANIDRWKGQFSGGDQDAAKSEEMTIGKWTVHLVDVAGNYKESMGGGPFAPGKTVLREKYAMVGAIIVHPEGRKFFAKMIGPGDVVKANRDAFAEMVKSIGK